MNGYNFTERVRKVLAMAREEAARLRHEYVGTEHILLGLIREGEGVAAAVLTNDHGDLLTALFGVQRSSPLVRSSISVSVGHCPICSESVKAAELEIPCLGFPLASDA